MPKIQKVIQRLFTTIFPDDYKPGEYEFFINFDDVHEIVENEELKELKDIYKNIVNENLANFILLSKVEETIIQIRCKKIVDKEMRLTIARNYIYARTLFYRRGHEINDIRVIVGKTDTYGDNIHTLGKNEYFINLCKEMLIRAMDKEIENNIKKIKSILVNV